MNREILSAMLYFDDKPVAALSDIFQDQGTWFADYRLVPKLTGRLMDFIEFSRVHLSSGDFADETYQGFETFYRTDRWTVEGPEFHQRIVGSPLFRETDLSWIA